MNELKNVVVSIASDITLGGKTETPDYPHITMPAYDTKKEETVIIFENYFSAFLRLYQQNTPLNLHLDQSKLPAGLPWGLTVKDFLHIVDGLAKYKDTDPLTIDCSFNGDGEVNITSAHLGISMPVACNLVHTDLGTKKDKTIMKFWFQITLQGVPMTMADDKGNRFLGFQTIEETVTDYRDD